MIDQKELINQLDIRDNIKDQENQITSKTIRNLILLTIYLLFYRYLYQSCQRKKKGNRSSWYSR